MYTKNDILFQMMEIYLPCLLRPLFLYLWREQEPVYRCLILMRREEIISGVLIDLFAPFSDFHQKAKLENNENAPRSYLVEERPKLSKPGARSSAT